MRFPNFEKPWDKTYLSKYLTVSSLRNKNNTYTRNDVLSVSGELGIVNQIELLGRSYAGESLLPYHIVEKDDVVYTKSPLAEYPYGIIKTNRIVPGIVSTLYAVYKSTTSSNNRFVEHYFSLKSRTNNYLKPIVRIGAKHDMKIGNEEVLKNYVVFPAVEEQTKIADFLDLIDERITTQSKIIEDLELVKKGIYNHIFTQLNSVEKVLLEDLLIDFNKRTLTDKQYPILSSTLSGIYLQEDYFNKQAASASTEGYKIVPYGFATYRSMSDTGEFRFNLQTIVENGIVSPAYPVFTCIENYRLDFILFCLNYYDDIKKQLFSMKQGGTRLALHFNSLCKLYIPQIDKEKQSKIMAIVNSYDAKIVVEKQILEKLKEQKKFLLSNMFI